MSGAIGRWARSLVRCRIADESGAARAVRFPSHARLVREGVPRPWRTVWRVASWRMMAVSFSVCVLGLVGNTAGVRAWHRWVLDPWMDAARANPIGAGRPPSMAPLLIIQAGSLMVMAVAMVALLPWMNRGVSRRYRSEMVGLCRCPWCSYDLSGSARGGDGIAVCPECGGLWRLGAVGQPAR